MSLTKLEKDMGIIQKLDDEPNDVGGLSAADLKKKFDESGETVKTFLNDTLIPEIEQSFAETAKKQDLSDVVLGQIPDHTLTEEKLSEDLSEKLNSAAPKETVFTREETLTQKTAALYGLTNEAVPDDLFELIHFFIPSEYGVLGVETKNSNGDAVVATFTVSPAIDGKTKFTTNSQGIAAIFAPPGEYTVKITTGIFAESDNPTATVTVNYGIVSIANFSVTIKEHGEATISESQSIDVPLWLTSLDLFGCGAGASGSVAYRKSGSTIYAYASGSGGGYTQTKLSQNLAGKTLDIQIGAGGTPVTVNAVNTDVLQSSTGLDGGTTTVKVNSSAILTANGGKHGKTEANDRVVPGGAGGSGGGSGGSEGKPGGAGGTNGSDGGSVNSNGGKGQGTTTKPFGDTSKTAFCCGGAGVGPAGSGSGGTPGKVASGNTNVIASDGVNYGDAGGSALLTASSYYSGTYAKSGAGHNGVVMLRW